MTLRIMKVVHNNALYNRFRDLGAFNDVEAVISSNLKYILALEYGHSQQAPVGIIRRYRNEYRAILREELQEALYRTGYDYAAAARAGITESALRILVKIVERTPVDTGRAKGSWIVTLPGGKVQQGARPVSETEQKARARVNAARKRRAAAKDRKKAARDRRRADRALAGAGKRVPSPRKRKGKARK